MDEGATVRAETVRVKLKELAETHEFIAVVSHRGFLAFLVEGERFRLCGEVLLLIRGFGIPAKLD
jgi:hypothetical protein